MRFTADAIEAVTAVLGGLPRVINVVCQRALEIGCESERRTIDRGIVMAAARVLKLPTAAARRG